MNKPPFRRVDPETCYTMTHRLSLGKNKPFIIAQNLVRMEEKPSQLVSINNLDLSELGDDFQNIYFGTMLDNTYLVSIINVFTGQDMISLVTEHLECSLYELCGLELLTEEMIAAVIGQVRDCGTSSSQQLIVLGNSWSRSSPADGFST